MWSSTTLHWFDFMEKTISTNQCFIKQPSFIFRSIVQCLLSYLLLLFVLFASSRGCVWSHSRNMGTKKSPLSSLFFLLFWPGLCIACLEIEIHVLRTVSVGCCSLLALSNLKKSKRGQRGKSDGSAVQLNRLEAVIVLCNWVRVESLVVIFWKLVIIVNRRNALNMGYFSYDVTSPKRGSFRHYKGLRDLSLSCGVFWHSGTYTPRTP